MSVGRRLVEERERLGLSQVAFFEACSVSKKAQFNFENDHNIPGGAYLIAAAGLGVDVLYVLTGRRAMQPPPGPVLRDGEATLLEGYRALDARGKAGVQALIGGMAPHPAPGVQVQVHGGTGHVVGPVTAGTLNMGAPAPVKRPRAVRKSTTGS